MYTENFSGAILLLYQAI